MTQLQADKLVDRARGINRRYAELVKSAQAGLQDVAKQFRRMAAELEREKKDVSDRAHDVTEQQEARFDRQLGIVASELGKQDMSFSSTADALQTLMEDM